MDKKVLIGIIVLLLLGMGWLVYSLMQEKQTNQELKHKLQAEQQLQLQGELQLQVAQQLLQLDQITLALHIHLHLHFCGTRNPCFYDFQLPHE